MVLLFSSAFLFLSQGSYSQLCFWLFMAQLGIDTVPVLIGPMTYLLLSKPAKGVEKSFCLLSLIDKILPVYK